MAGPDLHLNACENFIAFLGGIMKKRVLGLAAGAAMALSLVSCGGKNTAAKADKGEDYNIVMQIVTFGNEFSGIADVENAINKIVEPEIGVTVTLVPVAAWDLTTTSSLQITSGEKLDLMLILPMGAGLDNVTNYSSRNMLTPLNDLYAKYGKDIDCCIGSLAKVGYVGDELYAVPANYYAGDGYGFVARKAVVEELGFNFEEGKIYTASDLEPLFAAYKAKYGEGYYPVAMYSDIKPFNSFAAVDEMGSAAHGVLINYGDTKVVNEFATPEYKAYTTKMHEWYEKGYIHPDAATIKESFTNLLPTKKYLGAFSAVPGSDGMDAVAANSSQVGEELIAIKLMDDYATTTIASYGMWAIPVTSENPEKVMQFLNILYQDRELYSDVDSILAAGLEGKSYEIVESLGGSKAIVKYPEGVTPVTVPFEQMLPVYGNQFTVPKSAPLTAKIYDQFASYNSDIAKKNRYSRAFGYTFDTSKVQAQVAAVENVISQYRVLLDLGTVDPDEVLPVFNEALENAGIEDVIKENQRQLDDWLAKQK